jgi:hypothetical protein
MRVPQSRDELDAHLAEQLGFLRRSAFAYDAGESSEAKRMAATIRLLVHDTEKSQSLLGQLNLKSIAFVDGGAKPDPRNMAATTGLTGIRMGSDGTAYIPKFALPPGLPAPTRRSFVDWWRRPVIVDSHREEISREDLVLAMANTDGGSHVDASIERTYARLTRQNSVGWTLIGPQGNSPLLGIEFASMRQIAWELDETLKQREVNVYTPDTSAKVGRNDPCPCGSGMKFKKCHGRAS